MKKIPLLFSILTLFFIHIFVNSHVKAQVQDDTIRSLIVSEVFLGIHAGYSYAEFANAGDDTLDLMMFEVGSSNYESDPPYHDAVTRPWGFSWIRLGEWLPEEMRYLPPRQTIVIANADPSGAWCGITDGFSQNVELITEIADLVFWRSGDTICDICSEMTMALPVYHWSGWTCQYVEFHIGGDSVVIDAAHNPIRPDGTGPDRYVNDVAGITNATNTHILVRKASVTEGNLDWEDTRGTSYEDAEWMPVPLQFTYQYNPFIKMYTTLGSFDSAWVDAESFQSDVIDIDWDNHVLSVPWGIYGDSVIREFDLGPGLAWEYNLSGNGEDSLHQLARTDDTLTVWAAGHEFKETNFRIEVQDPPDDMAVVFPKNAPNTEYQRRLQSPFYVTKGCPGMDSITGPATYGRGTIYGPARTSIPYSTRVDTLLKYLEKAPNAKWEIIFKGGQPRADLLRGDILRVTAADNTTTKDYYIAVDTLLEISSNASLAYITWPDVPAYTMEDPLWRHDTIPRFSPDQFDYKLTVPYGINTVPALVAKPQSLNAKVEIKRAITLHGPVPDRTTTITVTAEDDTTINVYKVLFEKELLPANVQPFKADPFFSQFVFWQFQSHYFFEIAHTGNQPLDLSNYMVAIGTGGQNPADAIQAYLDPDMESYEQRYQKYIPGYQYEKFEYWQLEPGNIIKDFTIDPIVQPNDVFLMGTFVDHRLSWGPPRYLECDLKFKRGATGGDWPEEWTEEERATIVGTVFSHIKDMNHPIMLLKIKNDSIKQGKKPIGDPNDFEVVDIFGGYSGIPWVANTDTITDAGSNTWGWGLWRKPEIWHGNPLPEGSFGPTDAESEWISRSRESLIPEYGGWMSEVEVSTGVGYHTFDPVTVYKSTVSSYNYIVSEGFLTPQAIQGVVTGTKVSDFLNLILKAYEDQALRLLSSADGSILASDATLSDGDTLEVTSADEVNMTKYILSVTDEGLDNNAVLTSDIYTIEIDGSVGTISGFPYGTSIKTVLSNVVKPVTASLNVIDENDRLVPLQILNFDTVHVATQVSYSIYFEVIAQDMQTKITYHLQPTVSMSDAFVYSNVYDVNQQVKFISFIPTGTRVPALLNNLWTSKGASMNVYDKLGVERKIGPVSFDDVVVVISEDLTTVNIYYLGFLEEEEGTDAYVLSNVLLVNPLALTITGPIDGLSIGIFMNSIIPAPLATVKVVDEFGVEKTTGTIEAGKDKLVVTSGNGKTQPGAQQRKIITAEYSVILVYSSIPWRLIYDSKYVVYT